MRCVINLLSVGILAAVWCSAVVQGDDLDKVVVELNVAHKRSVQHDRLMVCLSSETGVSVATLRHRWVKCHRSFGEFYLAHTLAKTSGDSYEVILSERKAGWGWGRITKSRRMTLGQVVGTRRNTERSLDYAKAPHLIEHDDKSKYRVDALIDREMTKGSFGGSKTSGFGKAPRRNTGSSHGKGKK